MKQVLVWWTMVLAVTCEAQMQWWPTEVSATSGVWLAEGDMRDVVEAPAFGGYAGWMTRATNGWAAFFGGVEHGGFVGVHRIGSSLYGWQPQIGWTLRTGQTRLVGWSFSTGLAYNSTVYNAEEPDPRMEAVGSHLNALVRLGITVANDSPISLGLGILHTSNGGFVAPTRASTRRRRSSLFASWRRLVDVCTWTVQRPRISGQPLVWGWVDATMQRTAGTSTAFKSSSPKPRTSCPLAMASRPKRRSSTMEPCAPIPTPTLRRTPSRPTCWTAFNLG